MSFFTDICVFYLIYIIIYQAISRNGRIKKCVESLLSVPEEYTPLAAWAR